MPIKLKSSGGGDVTLDVPSTASTYTLTIPATTATVATTTGTLTNPTINGFTGDTSVINVGSGQLYKDASGNVGIGTSSPATSNGNVGRIMQVAASGNTSAAIVASSAGTGLDNAGVFEARATAQSSGSDRLGQIYFGRENTSTTALSSYVAIANSGSGTFSERARIDSSGNFYVNATTQNDSGKTNINYSAATNIGIGIKQTNSGGGTMLNFLNSSGTSVGSITQNGSNTAFNTSSDYRLKKNLTPLTDGLTRISALNPVSYVWKETDIEGEGFIAHELQDVIPLAVTGNKDAVDGNGNAKYQSVDYSKIVVHLVAAIQELKTELDATKAEVAALKGAV